MGNQSHADVDVQSYSPSKEKEVNNTIECVVTLRMTFDPKMDNEGDIKQRVEGEINTLLNHGHLEGCEHGAQLLHYEINISATRII